MILEKPRKWQGKGRPPGLPVNKREDGGEFYVGADDHHYDNFWECLDTFAPPKNGEFASWPLQDARARIVGALKAKPKKLPKKLPKKRSRMSREERTLLENIRNMLLADLNASNSTATSNEWAYAGDNYFQFPYSAQALRMLDDFLDGTPAGGIRVAEGVAREIIARANKAAEQISKNARELSDQLLADSNRKIDARWRKFEKNCSTHIEEQVRDRIDKMYGRQATVQRRKLHPGAFKIIYESLTK